MQSWAPERALHRLAGLGIALPQDEKAMAELEREVLRKSKEAADVLYRRWTPRTPPDIRMSNRDQHANFEQLKASEPGRQRGELQLFQKVCRMPRLRTFWLSPAPPDPKKRWFAVPSLDSVTRLPNRELRFERK
jgi:hypothetical protein